MTDILFEDQTTFLKTPQQNLTERCPLPILLTSKIVRNFVGILSILFQHKSPVTCAVGEYKEAVIRRS